jgi:hypothetical protein
MLMNQTTDLPIEQRNVPKIGMKFNIYLDETNPETIIRRDVNLGKLPTRVSLKRLFGRIDSICILNMPLTTADARDGARQRSSTFLRRATSNS